MFWQRIQRTLRQCLVVHLELEATMNDAKDVERTFWRWSSCSPQSGYSQRMPEIDKKTCQKKNASLRVWFVDMCSGSFGVSWYSMQTWSWKQKEIMDWNLTGSVFQCMVDHLDDTKRWQVDASEVFVNFPYLQSCKVVLVPQLFHGFPMFLFVHRLMHVDHVVYTNQTANIGEWGFIYLQYPSMINLT